MAGSAADVFLPLTGVLPSSGTTLMTRLPSLNASPKVPSPIFRTLQGSAGTRAVTNTRTLMCGRRGDRVGSCAGTEPLLGRVGAPSGSSWGVRVGSRVSNRPLPQGGPTEHCTSGWEARGWCGVGPGRER